MKKVAKVLLLTIGFAAFGATAYGAWTITVTGDNTPVERVVSPSITADYGLSEFGLNVTDSDTHIALVPDASSASSDLHASFLVKPQKTEWYDNVASLDPEQKVNLQISYVINADSDDYLAYLAFPAESSINLAPQAWLNDPAGYVYNFDLDWAMAGGPVAYANETYFTAEGRKAYLDGVSAAIEGINSIVVSFDLVAGA